MDLSKRFPNLLNHPAQASFWLGAGSGVVIASVFINQLAASWRTARPSLFQSPPKTVAQLTSEEAEKVPYPPNALPGGRDVDTPYGSIRVYEWGPKDGRKVLFVHGISTPCVAFVGIAKGLVENGCRVMLFDLFGRGYSDCPDPLTNPQNLQLFTTQIHLVLASSELAWTGESRFTLVGYSLGGGVAAAFTSYFPTMVESLILVAPAGLLRPSRIAWSSRLLYGGLLPQPLINWLVRSRLSSGAPPIGRKAGAHSGNPEATGPAKAATSEVPGNGHPAHAPNSSAQLFPDRPGLSIAKVVGWELDSHPGFLAAFISSIQHAPISSQHERWQLIGSRLTQQRSSSTVDGLKEGKVLVLLGSTDRVILSDEVAADATEALGKDNVKIVVLEGGHDVPVVNSQGCLAAIEEFWTTGKS